MKLFTLADRSAAQVLRVRAHVRVRIKKTRRVAVICTGGGVYTRKMMLLSQRVVTATLFLTLSSVSALECPLQGKLFLLTRDTL